MKKKLSVVVSAYNEKTKLEACLTSVSFADEIIVVDNSSTDKTSLIAKKFTSKVFKRSNNPMLNINKNFGFLKATGDWILSLDADERITKELAEEIINEIEGESVAGFWICRKNIIFGKWIENSIWWPDYQLRLFQRRVGKFPEKHVHEYLEVDGETKKLKNPMIHENYSSVSQFLQKMDKIYTENEAQNYIKSGKSINWRDAIRFPVQDFIKTYFSQKGYKDGLHGLVLSILQAFYSEVVFAKIWEKQNFFQEEIGLRDLRNELKTIKHELNYWEQSVLLGEEKNIFKKILQKIKRKRAVYFLRKPS